MVPVQHWRRSDWFDETGLAWINPSPNMRNLIQATLYPGIGSIEASNVSVGRGTDTPFEQIGAPWLDGVRLAAALNARSIPGIRFYPVRFTPTASKYAKEECGGVFMIVTDREALRPTRLGLEIVAALVQQHRRTTRSIPTTAGRIARVAHTRPERRGPGGCRRELGRRRGAVASAAREVSDLHAVSRSTRRHMR